MNFARKSLAAVKDLEQVVCDVLKAHPDEAKQYQSGKHVLEFFTSQVMRALKGKCNPALVNALLKKKLGWEGNAD